MKTDAEIYYGGYLKEEIERAIKQAQHFDNVELSEQEAEAVIEEQYYDVFYYIDFDNISEQFVNNHYISYRELFITEKYNVFKTKFAGGIAEYLRNIFNLGFNQTTYKLSKDKIYVIGLFAVINDNIQMVEDFMKSHDWQPIEHQTVYRTDRTV